MSASPHLVREGRPIINSKSHITACMRCRQRKKRCDQKLPACGLCAAAGVKCVISDSAAHKQISRRYVHDLEERVAYLEDQLRQAQSQSNNIERLNGESPLLPVSTDVWSGLNSPQQLVIEAEAEATLGHLLRLSQPPQTDSCSNEFLFSKILLSGLSHSELVNIRTPASARVSTAADEDSDVLDKLASGIESTPLPLPDKRSCDYFVKAYFEFANFSLPLLHEPTFRSKLDGLYQESPLALEQRRTGKGNKETKLALFFANMVFAIGLLVLQKHNTAKVPTTLCNRYCSTAMGMLSELTLTESVEGIQGMLLLAQYSYLHPTDFGGWDTVGLALRCAVKLDFHRDPPAGTYDALTLDTIRRTFWVAYSMDRNIALATGRPTCVSDGIITAKFPNVEADESRENVVPNVQTHESPSNKKQYSRIYFQYRRLQSEMHTVLNEEPAFNLAPIDYGAWQADMFDRIKRWYGDICHKCGHVETESSHIAPPEVIELTFHRAVVLLYQPSRMIPNPTLEAMGTLARSSICVINLYKRFYRENKLRLFWQAVKNLFNAATSLMYCYVNSCQVQSSLSPRSLESLLNLSSNILWGMVERCPSLAGKRDAFDAIVSKFLAELNDQYSGSYKSAPPSSLGSGESPYLNSFPSEALQGVTFDVRSAQDRRQMPSVSSRDILEMPPGATACESIRQQHLHTEGAESQLRFTQGFEDGDVVSGAVNPIINDESFQPYLDLGDFDNDMVSSTMVAWED